MKGFEDYIKVNYTYVSPKDGRQTHSLADYAAERAAVSALRKRGRGGLRFWGYLSPSYWRTKNALIYHATGEIRKKVEALSIDGIVSPGLTGFTSVAETEEEAVTRGEFFIGLVETALAEWYPKVKVHARITSRLPALAIQKSSGNS